MPVDSATIVSTTFDVEYGNSFVIGVSPVDELGNLIDIFSMSSYDIEEKYGVRIESLIEYYKNVNSRRLCV